MARSPDAKPVEQARAKEPEPAKPVCGIVRPISIPEGYQPGHWDEVHKIVAEAASEAGYDASLVSEGEDIGVIQTRIVRNLYENPVVVCDVSSKNANVMFELGLRLAFDKPTIVIKDDATNYNFDTSPIQHLPYPKSLRYFEMLDFQSKLTAKIRKAADVENDHASFLSAFGSFKVAELDVQRVPATEFMISELASLRRSIDRLSARPVIVETPFSYSAPVGERRYEVVATFKDYHDLERLRVRLGKSIIEQRVEKLDGTSGQATARFRLMADSAEDANKKLFEASGGNLVSSNVVPI